MYGIAGHTHTPGQPALTSMDAAARDRNRVAKAQAKTRKPKRQALRNVDSKERYKEARNAIH